MFNKTFDKPLALYISYSYISEDFLTIFFLRGHWTKTVLDTDLTKMQADHYIV